MKGLGRTLVINLVVIVVLAGAAYIGYSYWYQGYTWVTGVKSVVVFWVGSREKLPAVAGPISDT